MVSSLAKPSRRQTPDRASGLRLRTPFSAQQRPPRVLDEGPQLCHKVERLGRQAIDLATEPQPWPGTVPARPGRILLGDLDGAIDALEKGSIESSRVATCRRRRSPCSRGRSIGKGRHDEALAAQPKCSNERVIPRQWLVGLDVVPRFRTRSSWVSTDVTLKPQPSCAPLEDSDIPQTPGVMTSVVVVLAAWQTYEAMSRLPGCCSSTQAKRSLPGLRTPVDVALYSHYLAKVHSEIDDETATHNHERAGPG